jgi:predicted TIM-barrel fold metal-dependent hydrolase
MYSQSKAECSKEAQAMSKHVILAGDSIFDNAVYVPGEPCVTEQLRALVGDTSSVSMVAVDGDYVSDVWRQVRSFPVGATHILVSAGGNDALRHAHKLGYEYSSSANLFKDWAEIQAGFRREYRQMLEAILALELPVAICTVYDAVPIIGAVEVTALSLFNDVITSEAIASGIPIIDLRRVCAEPTDYSPISPIEPSSQGGEKIAAAIQRMLELHDFSTRRTVIYT